MHVSTQPRNFPCFLPRKNGIAITFMFFFLWSQYRKSLSHIFVWLAVDFSGICVGSLCFLLFLCLSIMVIITSNETHAYFHLFINVS